MFEGFFYELREKGIQVSLSEWMALQHGLNENLAEEGLTAFYYLARAVLVKNESFFDRYDNAFKSYFQGIETPDAMIEEILEGLERVEPFSPDLLERLRMSGLSLEEVMKKFREQYEAGHFKQHVGGDRAIGVGGKSPFGAFGYNPSGVRIGQGGSRQGSAIKIAEERRFRNYSSDVVLDTRQLRVALSRLRTLLPQGPMDELDIEDTIDKTCLNAGDLDLVWKRDKKNSVKLLLLMDSGGTMSPHARVVSLLFSAAKSQFKDFKHYYFHNCVYQDLWKDIQQKDESVPTQEVLNNLDGEYKVIIVGDAYMAPSELLDVNGTISYFDYNETPGIVWLHRISEKFPASVWISPDPPRFWNSVATASIIRRIFPMFELTLEGLDDAIRALLKLKRPRMTRAELRAVMNNRAAAW